MKSYKVLIGAVVFATFGLAITAGANDFLKTGVKTMAENSNIDTEKSYSTVDFLEKNKNNPKIHVLENGLQYRVEQEGHGSMPKASDEVTVMYEGKLINGKVFDSSYERGQPATFRVDQVIQGWQIALQKMPEGSIWTLYIPADLAYGERGVAGVIPPNSVLIFKVELQKIATT